MNHLLAETLRRDITSHTTIVGMLFIEHKHVYKYMKHGPLRAVAKQESSIKV